MRHAFLAGVPRSRRLTGLVGYFVVLRSQVFTGDALSHVAFTGALGALAFGHRPARSGCSPRPSLVGGWCSGVLGNRGPGRRRRRSARVFAWVLGLGVLVLSLYTTSASAATNGAAGVTVLFGSIFGLERRAGGGRLRSSPAGCVAVVARHRPAAAVRQPRRGGRRRPRGAGPAAGHRLPRPGRRDRGRGHPGGRRAAARSACSLPPPAQPCGSPTDRTSRWAWLRCSRSWRWSWG